MKIYSKANFHKHTFCLWQEVSFESIDGLSKNHNSKSGSAYIFVEEGVYRISNHRGRVANCRWRLLPLGNYKNQQIKVGFATWNDFFPNDETSKLFFIKVNYEGNDVDFYHKMSKDYDNKSILTNAVDTSKKIKTIKEILNNTSWAKHFKYNDLNLLRRQLVEQLLYSEKSFNEIKKRYL